ncbi:MAG: rhodanese-like domain-containing protein [Bacteroidaceae bacterium]|nr:rhodanese-like domain-containing protein [Bacteroidaceae bacterium]
MKKSLVALLLSTPLMCLILSCSNDNMNYLSVDVEEFEAAISDTTVQVLDVRTAEEYMEGHIERSINIDVKTDTFEVGANTRLNKSHTVALYCRSGRRSKKAAEILSNNGFKVIELNEGITSWTNNNKTTIK